MSVQGNFEEEVRKHSWFYAPDTFSRTQLLLFLPKIIFALNLPV